MSFSSWKNESKGVFSSVQENSIEAAPTEMEYSEFHEAHERSLKTSVIRVGIVWLFSSIVIFAALSLGIPLYFVSQADLKLRVQILGIICTSLKDLRMQLQILGIVCTVWQSVNKVHWALGSAIVFIRAMMYYSSKEKQSRGVLSSVKENSIGEAPTEVKKENNVVVNPSFFTPLNSPEASQQFWKPISLLNVKLEPEYSVGKMSSSQSTRIRNKVISEKVISEVKVKLEMVFSVEERRFSEKMAPVGSFSSSTECKAKVPLRRSMRIHNKVVLEELMTEEELRQVDDATLSAISFGLETSMVPPVPRGQSAGDELGPIDKGKGVATGDEPMQIPHCRCSGISIRTESPIETPSAHKVGRESFVSLMMQPLYPEEEPTLATISEVQALPRAYEMTPNRRKRLTREEASNLPSSAKRLHFDHPPAA